MYLGYNVKNVWISIRLENCPPKIEKLFLRWSAGLNVFLDWAQIGENSGL